MKLILLCLFNILFSDILSDWLEINSDIINSASYKISFEQRNESVIGGGSYFQTDTSTSILVFNNQIQYESKDRIIVLSKNTSKLLNKNTNQLFIDNIDSELSMFLDIDLIQLLSNNVSINNCYDIQLDFFSNFKLCFNHNNSPSFSILSQNMNIDLININFSKVDSLRMVKYFKIDEKFLSVFDLRKQ